MSLDDKLKKAESNITTATGGGGTLSDMITAAEQNINPRQQVVDRTRSATYANQYDQLRGMDEFNPFASDSLGTAGIYGLATALSTDPVEQGRIIANLTAGNPDVSVTEVQGVPVIKIKDKQYVLNKPGLSGADAWNFLAESLTFVPGGFLIKGVKTIIGKILLNTASVGLTQAGKEAMSPMVGGDADYETALLFGGAAGIGTAIGTSLAPATRALANTETVKSLARKVESGKMTEKEAIDKMLKDRQFKNDLKKAQQTESDNAYDSHIANNADNAEALKPIKKNRMKNWDAEQRYIDAAGAKALEYINEGGNDPRALRDMFKIILDDDYNHVLSIEQRRRLIKMYKAVKSGNPIEEDLDAMALQYATGNMRSRLSNDLIKTVDNGEKIVKRFEDARQRLKKANPAQKKNIA